MAIPPEKKHGPNAQVAPDLKNAVQEAARDGALPCAVAHALAGKMNVPPAEVGKAADLAGLHLKKCQLGLFGYKPEKKIVRPAAQVSAELKQAIESRVQNGRISCAGCWEIAKELGLNKMAVSAACETLSFKIKPCQLGAF